MRAGTPRSIDDLRAYNAIGFRLLRAGAIYGWDLQQEGKDIKVDVQGTVRVSDPAGARELALAGVGIAYIFEPLIREDLSAGRLIEVLPEASIEEPGLSLLPAARLTRNEDPGAAERGRGGTGRSAARPVSQTLDQYREGGRGLAPARVVQMIARPGRAPFLQNPRQATRSEMRPG